MHTIKLVLAALTRNERKAIIIAFAALLIALAAWIFITLQEKSVLIPVAGGTYTEGIVGQPIMVNPILSERQTDKDLSALLFSPLFSLLDDWNSSPDGKTYTVKLKEGLTWDDGVPLTSDDVLFTVDTIQDPAARSPLGKDWQGIIMERTSQLQVKFTLPTPYVFFTENLKRTRLIPKHIFSAIPIDNVRLSDYNLEPVGSGPFAFERLAKRRDGFITEYRLKVNEHYSGARPHIDHFTITFYSTQDDLLADMRLRRVQGFGSTLPLSTEIKNLPRITEDAVAMPRYYALFMNAVNNSALKDADLRNALGLAINKEKLVRDVFKEYGAPLDSPILKTLVRFEPQDALGTTTIPQWQNTSTSTPEYDPVRAARSIAAMKIKDIRLSLVVPHIAIFEKAAEVIKQDWLAAGIAEVNVRSENVDTITNNLIPSRNYELLLFGNTYENPADIFPFWHSSQRFSPGLNLSLYQSLEADRLMETVRQKNDAAVQGQSLARLEALLQRDTPAIPLFSLPYFYVHTSSLAGFAPEMFVTPEDRFRNVEQWSMATARVLK